jgi:Na+-transporting NADH:ubiquinone oxidoreductase subunit NqrC
VNALLLFIIVMSRFVSVCVSTVYYNIQYTVETQTEEKLNYLDITIINSNNTFTFEFIDIQTYLRG